MTSPSSSNDTKTTFEEIYFYPTHQYKEPQDTLIVMMFEMVDSIGSDVEDHERWFLEVYSSNVLKDLSAVSRASPLGYNNIFLNNFENIFQISQTQTQMIETNFAKQNEFWNKIKFKP